MVGPPGTRALAEHLIRSHQLAIRAQAQALGLPQAGASFEAIEIEDGWSETRGELALRAGALPGGPLPALAYRFEAAGRSVVVAPTGWAPAALLGFARGAHVLVHEAAFVPTPDLAQEIGLDVDTERLRREGALHTSIEAVGELASRAGVETLVLVRLRPPPVYDLQITEPRRRPLRRAHRDRRRRRRDHTVRPASSGGSGRSRSRLRSGRSAGSGGRSSAGLSPVKRRRCSR